MDRHGVAGYFAGLLGRRKRDREALESSPSPSPSAGPNKTNGTNTNTNTNTSTHHHSRSPSSRCTHTSCTQEANNDCSSTSEAFDSSDDEQVARRFQRRLQRERNNTRTPSHMQRNQTTISDSPKKKKKKKKAAKRLPASQLVPIAKTAAAIATKNSDFEDHHASDSSHDLISSTRTAGGKERVSRRRTLHSSFRNSNSNSSSNNDDDDDSDNTFDAAKKASPKKGTRKASPSTITGTASTSTSTSTTRLAGQSDNDDDDFDYTVSNSDDVHEKEIDFFKSHCWKCHAMLLMTNDAFCFYGLHPHPLLQVPICSVCREEVLAVERALADHCNTGFNTEDEGSDGCSGCGGGGDGGGESEGDDDENNNRDIDILFLCDNCPRGFCQGCMAKCYGGGTRGTKQTQFLQLEDNDDKDNNKKWSCPFCVPPPPLSILQTYTKQHRIADEEASKHRSVASIISDLHKVEQERIECEHQLRPEILEEKRAEVRTELIATSSSSSSSSSMPDMKCIDAAVEEEMHLWEIQWDKHDQRLADRVVKLQEQIESRGESLVAVYCAIHSKEGITIQPLNAEPEWKKDADAEIQRREEEEEDTEDLPLQNPLDPAIYKKDIPEDVEDLGVSDQGEGENKRSQWRHGRRRVKLEAVEEVLEVENKMLQERGIPVVRVDDDAPDLDVDDDYELIIRRETVYQANTKACLEPPQKRLRASASTTTTNTRHQSGELNGKAKSEGLSDTIVICNSPDPIDTSDYIARLPTTNDENAEKLSLVLSSPNSGHTVTIAQPLAEKLKTHQVSGVHFMWTNSFVDLAYTDAPAGIVEKVGGCILAHNMGLGKSLTCIALLHALLSKRLMRTVLLVVPTNVISHWQNEIEQWTGPLPSPITVFNLGTVQKASRQQEIQRWSRMGGILLVSSSTFVSLEKNPNYAVALLNPDIVIVDEAHLMLRNCSKIMTALTRIKTPRRIALTGSPIQNNLNEYYSMVSWVRPGILGDSESAFDREYAVPIVAGLASDASSTVVQRSDEVSKKLHHLLAPFVQRKDATILLEDLPTMQQVILVIRQSKTQANLYRAFANYKNKKGISNFFKTYQMVRPVHNHPGTLLLGGMDVQETDFNLETVDDDVEYVPPPRKDVAMSGPKSDDNEEDWWRKTAERQGGAEKFNEVEKGYKVVLLLHILMEAQLIGDKVLVFSQCLRTLDFLEYVLGLEDWLDHVPTLQSSLIAGVKRGGWTKGCDYLRIDGHTQFSERGELIDIFNDGLSSATKPFKPGVENKVKAFLLSSTAGGIGINLVAANRVVLFDSSFNPTIMTQAVFRSYRYGQTKPVFAYRLMTEGSVEEKIYSRSVNKTGIALRVIDNKTIARSFTQKELEDLEETDTWAQCDRCQKWRMLPRDVDSGELPEQWFCEMNQGDAVNNNCSAPEKDKYWYDRRAIDGLTKTLHESPIECMARDGGDSALSTDEKERLVGNDVILKKLLTVTARDRRSVIIAKHFFHEALLAETNDDASTLLVTGSDPTLEEPPRRKTASPAKTSTLKKSRGRQKGMKEHRSQTSDEDSARESPEDSGSKSSQSRLPECKHTVKLPKRSRREGKKESRSRSGEEQEKKQDSSGLSSRNVLLSRKSNPEVIEIWSDSDDLF